MLFSTTIFLFVFLPLVLAVYYNPVIRSRQFRNVFLLLASIFFYAWGEPFYVLLMLLSIVVNWGLGLLVDRFRNRPGEKAVLLVTVVYNLGVLFLFKYLNFTVNNLNLLFRSDIRVPQIALPVGISFYTFQAMSYVLDVHRGKGEAQKNPLNVGLYIALFPQLIAGPIVRYETVAWQIGHRQETLHGFYEGILRFIYGLGKKILLANTLALGADACFGAIAERNLSFGAAWLGAIFYSLQILFDFSGYSDMAIGLGKMFGFEFLENFNYPYISRTVAYFFEQLVPGLCIHSPGRQPGQLPGAAHFQFVCGVAAHRHLARRQLDVHPLGAHVLRGAHHRKNERPGQKAPASLPGVHSDHRHRGLDHLPVRQPAPGSEIHRQHVRCRLRRIC